MSYLLGLIEDLMEMLQRCLKADTAVVGHDEVFNKCGAHLSKANAHFTPRRGPIRTAFGRKAAFETSVRTACSLVLYA